MRCKPTVDAGFLQDTCNDAAFNTALPTVTQFFTVMNIVWARYSALCVQDLVSAVLYAFLKARL